MSDPTVAGLLSYLDASPTSFHAVAETARQLDALGAVPLELADEAAPLSPGSIVYVRDAGTLIAVRLGNDTPVQGGFRMIAAHTDSPNLRIKPQPLVRSHGYLRLGVEVYGGVQVATWVDRDLGIAGRVQVRSGTGTEGRLVDIRRPLCRVPTLAIHLNRTVNSEGLKLNEQTQLPAMFATDDAGDDRDPLRALLAETLDVSADSIVSWDLSLFDLTTPTLGGARDAYVFSGRLDNLASCHAGLDAFVRSSASRSSHVLALFDHEEIGSQTVRGANSHILESVLARVSAPAGSADMTRAMANSWLLSADMAHAVHPSFVDKHDAEHMPKINAGPTIKQNINHRYATEDDTAAMFMLLCERAEVPMQYYVHRNDLRCGSTVGPMLSARLGVRSLDVGNPMLSMHSCREQCGAHDHPRMAKVMARFFTDPLS